MGDRIIRTVCLVNKTQSGFTLIELMVVLAILAAMVSLVGPPLFKRVDKTKSSAEEKKLEYIFEAAKMTAFSRKKPMVIKLEDNELVILDIEGNPSDRAQFDYLVFETIRIQFNANGFSDKKEIRYISENGEKTLFLE